MIGLLDKEKFQKFEQGGKIGVRAGPLLLWVVIFWMRHPQEVSMNFTKLLRYILFASAIAGVLLNIPDIKRYIKISTM